MRRASLAGSLAALAPAACATGEAGHGAHEPAYVPYRCADGSGIQVAYDQGGWFVRARASLVQAGQSHALKASPPTFGLRYVSADDAADPILIWTVQGERATLSQIARDAPSETAERIVASCERLREAAAEPHGTADAHR